MSGSEEFSGGLDLVVVRSLDFFDGGEFSGGLDLVVGGLDLFDFEGGE